MHIKKLLALVLLSLFLSSCDHPAFRDQKPRVVALTQDERNNYEILSAFRKKQSNILVQGSGRVVRILADDKKGTPHQRFIVNMKHDQTVLIAHNTAVGIPVKDLDMGNIIHFRGEYEYNAKGGVIHWTHRDPDGKKPGGWIEHKGVRYE